MAHSPVVLNNLSVFWQTQKRLSRPQAEVLASTLPFLGEKFAQEDDAVALPATKEQALQVGRALALSDRWSYGGKKDGFHVLNAGRDTVEVTVRKGANGGQSYYARTKGKNGRYSMSRATSGLTTYTAHKRHWVVGDVYKHFNDLRGGSWDKANRRYVWNDDIAPSARGRWHKALEAFSFPASDGKELPAHVQLLLQQQAVWSKYHIIALWKTGRAIDVDYSVTYTVQGDQPPAMTTERFWEHVREGYIYEMWQIAGFDYRARPKRTDFPLSATQEDVEAALEWLADSENRLPNQAVDESEAEQPCESCGDPVVGHDLCQACYDIIEDAADLAADGAARPHFEEGKLEIVGGVADEEIPF